ncbi:MAG: hypothetical protein LQ352_004583 [Teloschistes flavicans]|nr:MAG: hypothetical protein LQ352_004583 [Teloschistes flavicans]
MEMALSQNLLRIESNRDRQEAAILVFTVVTIIFLPLSFVSSFFGMNVNDIRSMGRSQWIFWASALPLTAIVAGVSLFIAYKIEPVRDLWSGVADRWRSRDAPAELNPAPTITEDVPGEKVDAIDRVKLSAQFRVPSCGKVFLSYLAAVTKLALTGPCSPSRQGQGVIVRNGTSHIKDTTTWHDLENGSNPRRACILE